MSETPVLFSDSIAPVRSGSDLLLSLPEQTLGVYTSHPVGVRGIPRKDTPGTNSWVSLLLILFFLLISGSYRSSNKFMHYIFSEVFEYKERSGFHQKSTMSMVRLKILLLLMTFILEGISLYIIFRQYFPQTLLTDLQSISLIGIFTAAFLTCFLIQWICFSIVSNTFSNKTSTGMVSGALSGITIFRGLLLFIPVLVSIYHTIPLKSFIFITVLLYFTTRLLFIYKGVKIFFRDFYSLIYVVLYLCTFEIAPLLVIYKGLFLMFSFVELKLL